MAERPPNRSLSAAGTALRYALQSGLPELERAALTVLARIERKHRGHLSNIAAELGVSRSTYHGWLRDFSELQAIHDSVK